MKIDNEIADPLLELNLKVAAIAGWENIQEWNPKNPKVRKVFQGTNKKHPELGIFVPDYTSDLNAITKAFDFLGLDWAVGWGGYAYNTGDHGELLSEAMGATPAIALCELLLCIALTLSSELETVETLGNPVAYSKLKPERGDFVTIAGLEIEA